MTISAYRSCFPYLNSIILRSIFQTIQKNAILADLTWFWDSQKMNTPDFLLGDVFWSGKYCSCICKLVNLSSHLRMARSIYQFYAKGSSYEEMHRRNRDLCSRWAKYIPSTSFKFLVGGYNRSISQSRQREIIESFSYMAFLGKIDMKNPEITFGCFEERASLPHSMVQKKNNDWLYYRSRHSTSV